jgi:aminoacyl-tRNA hydrolase
LHGTHLALSVLAALGVALAVGLPIERAIAALAQAQPAEGRMQIVTGDDGVVFLRDDWKAPQWSLQAPLEFMRNARAQRKVVIIGTISDSPRSPSQRYPRAAQQALEVADLVVFVGTESVKALKARRHPDDNAILAFPEIREAARYLGTELRAGDLVLLKGSNKADHLVRIILNRSKPVQCWRVGCGLGNFCGICALLDTPSHANASYSVQTATSASDSTELPALQRISGHRIPVVVGLGNPGAHYRNTPHNVGYRALDVLADAAGSDWEEQPEGLVRTVVLGGVSVKLLKPGVNINSSGSMVQRFLDRAGSDPSRCIIVHDEMDIALGDVRLKHDGGDAGHRGVRSVISALGTGAFQRIRIGVRRPGDTRQAEQVVLEKFSAVEETMLVPALEQAAEAVTESVQKWRDGEILVA